MNTLYEESSAARWFISGIAALCGIILFMILSLRTGQHKELPVLQPHLEINFVTVDEPPHPKEVPPPPQPVQPKHSVPEESPPQTIKEPKAPEPPLLEAMTTAPAAADIPVAPPVNPTPPVTQQPLRIGSARELDNVNFDPVFNPRPVYPAVAQAAGISGYVDVDLIIGDNGKVHSFNIVNITGHPAFGTETAKVLPKWRFPPPRIGGKTASVKYLYRIKFTLTALE